MKQGSLIKRALAWTFSPETVKVRLSKKAIKRAIYPPHQNLKTKKQYGSVQKW
jgi:hypothetical protein